MKTQLPVSMSWSSVFSESDYGYYAFPNKESVDLSKYVFEFDGNIEIVSESSNRVVKKFDTDVGLVYLKEYKTVENGVVKTGVDDDITVNDIESAPYRNRFQAEIGYDVLRLLGVPVPMTQFGRGWEASIGVKGAKSFGEYSSFPDEFVDDFLTDLAIIFALGFRDVNSSNIQMTKSNSIYFIDLNLNHYTQKLVYNSHYLLIDVIENLVEMTDSFTADYVYEYAYITELRAVKIAEYLLRNIGFITNITSHNGKFNNLRENMIDLEEYFSYQLQKTIEKAPLINEEFINNSRMYSLDSISTDNIWSLYIYDDENNPR